MEWTQGQIFTTTKGQELVGAVLIGADVQGYSVLDAEDFCEFLKGTELYWDSVDKSLMPIKDCETTITFYIPKNKQGKDMLNKIKKELSELKNSDTDGSLGRLELCLSSVYDDDWADNWKKYFKPIPVGERLLIRPSWEEVANEENRIVLEIDPASAFGTGKHETTKLCLELIEETAEEGKYVLDVGCGSGILSIAALLLGAEEAIGVDIDENAAKTAYENAVKNGLGDKFKPMWGDPSNNPELSNNLKKRKYDLICANIVSDVLIDMSELLKELLSENGNLIASGIIEERKDEVGSVFSKAGLDVVKSIHDGGWCALLCRNR